MTGLNPTKTYSAVLQSFQWLIWDKFGFSPIKTLKGPKQKTKLLTEFDEMIYDHQRMNWVDIECDMTLNEYNLLQELLEILNMNLNINLD